MRTWLCRPCSYIHLVCTLALLIAVMGGFYCWQNEVVHRMACMAEFRAATDTDDRMSAMQDVLDANQALSPFEIAYLVGGNDPQWCDGCLTPDSHIYIHFPDDGHRYLTLNSTQHFFLYPFTWDDIVARQPDADDSARLQREVQKRYAAAVTLLDDLRRIALTPLH